MYRTYFVVVNDSQYKDTVHQELVGATGSQTIPNREVICINPMPFSDYNGTFVLSDEEAIALKADSRIRDVHLSPADVGAEAKPLGIRSGNYDKTVNAVTASSTKNWGLARCISASNNFGTLSTLTNYSYNLTGAGVDIIIVDTGVEPWHPEFAVNNNGTGGTRFVDIDWTTYGAISVAPLGGFAGDCDGHGTNCASIAAGNTHGWASDAKIYSLRVLGSTTNRDVTDNRLLGSVDDLQAWQTIKLFHESKSVDPATGYKRPTIVNASYGYSVAYNYMTSVTHRGHTYSATTTTGNASLCFGTLGTNTSPGDGSCPYRYTALDADVSSAIAAGVIVCGAAGNDAHKNDIPTGPDYNNYWTSSVYGNNYYHQGASPTSADGVICVGAVSYATPEHKGQFSNAGPRVDIFAPGWMITGAYSSSSVSGFASYADPRSSSSTSSGATYYINRLTGTSMASPQIAGICALFAQLRPQSTGSTVKSWVTGTAVKNMLDETYYGVLTSTGTYTTWGHLQGAINNYAYMPYNLPNPLTIV